MEAYYERDAGVIRRMLAVPGHSSRWDGMAEAVAGRRRAPGGAGARSEEAHAGAARGR